MRYHYVRGNLFHFLETSSNELKYEYIEDGILEMQEGKITAIGSWKKFKNNIAKAKIIHYPDCLILPGFIDCHMHLANIDAVATTSNDLFSWLNQYIFPTEKRLSDKNFAIQLAEFFVKELIRNGTTSAMVFNSIYEHAVDALFDAAQRRNMRLITGKTVGDRNLPDYLIESPDSIYQETKKLIQKWHRKTDTRLLYAITPRFVPTTTDELFKKLQELKSEFPDVYVHTHISETVKDVEWTKKLSGLPLYLDSYDKFGLVGKGTLLAHGIYLTDDEMCRIAKANAGVAFCPTSNFYLGSGLFNLHKAHDHSLNIGIGSDIGAGTSFSLLQTLGEGYKVAKLNEQTLSALKGFYYATLGGAKAIGIDQYVGNFKIGKEADFVVVDMIGATPFIERRFSFAKTLEEKLFILMILGDDRSIVETYIAGIPQYINKFN